MIEATGRNWNERSFVDRTAELSLKESLNAWELIEVVGMGHFTTGMDRQTISLAINEVFKELILDVIKQVIFNHSLMLTTLKIAFTYTPYLPTHWQEKVQLKYHYKISIFTYTFKV